MTNLNPRLSPHGPAELPRQPRPEPSDTSASGNAFGELLAGASPSPIHPTNDGSSVAARAVQDQLRAGLARGGERRELLAGLVESRWHERFGSPAPPDLVAHVSEQLAGDPRVTALYGRLATTLSHDSDGTGGAR